MWVSFQSKKDGKRTEFGDVGQLRNVERLLKHLLNRGNN